MQINNLARDNLRDKLGIMSDLVTDEFWPWFANYMVVKRAAQVSCTASQVVLASATHDTCGFIEACASCTSAPVGTPAHRLTYCRAHTAAKTLPDTAAFSLAVEAIFRACYPPLSNAQA